MWDLGRVGIEVLGIFVVGTDAEEGLGFFKILGIWSTSSSSSKLRFILMDLSISSRTEEEVVFVVAPVFVPVFVSASVVPFPEGDDGDSS